MCHAGKSTTVERRTIGAVCLNCLRDQRQQRDRLQGEDQLAGLNLLDVQNVVDQPNQAVAIRAGNVSAWAAVLSAIGRPNTAKSPA